ncbi:MAG: glycosyltransferase family 2 protein [Ruminococcaceae bacterium]|nr:glycosyltransferase family 2 protein [Oscillospiraceae bacterium]
MKLLTIYTPAYNRREHLKKAYDSLVAQTSSDFIWLVVDDGSTDGTEELMAEFIAENKIEIKYIKKENGGKHTATNVALEKCNTELIMLALDSDDFLKENAVSRVVEDYCKTGGKYNGYVYMKEDSRGKLFEKKYSDDLSVMSWQEAVVGGHFDGEALLILKSSYAGKFSYPVIEGEKFFTEAYVYLQMTEPFLWSRESIYVAEYLEDGYTKNIMKSFVGNPVSYMMYNSLRTELYTSPVKRLKYGAYYCGFSMLARERGFVKKCPKPLWALLSLPFGLAFYLLLKSKKK